MRFDDVWERSLRALKSTAPIFRLDERGRHDLFGSGVFVRYHSRYFVASAGHVLAELSDGPLWIGGEDLIMMLAGPFFHTGQPGERTFDGEPFDVAFVPLSDDQVAALAGTDFVSLDDLIEPQPIEPGVELYIVGFIAGDFKPVGPRQVVETKGTVLGAVSAPRDKYSVRGVSQETHLLLPFDRLKSYGPAGQAATPVLAGMSGCGVWSSRHDGDADRLVAILTEHHQKDGKFIVSTRVETLIPGLAAYVAGKLTTKRTTS